MILWTIQHEAAYEAMPENGNLHANEDFLFCQNDFRFAYDWMAEQMCKRIGLPPIGAHHPVWAWYQWEGVRKRPDMRTHRYWATQGTPIVLLTIDVPDAHVLLSDFEMWHYVLNDWHLPLRKSDIKDEFTETEKLQSRDNIFFWEKTTDLWDNTRSTQATFWELKKEWVLKSESFVSG